MIQKLFGGNCDCLFGMNNKDFALTLVRVGVALVFIYHGWMKVNGMEGTLGFFSSLGIPAFLTYFVAYVELLGGLALLAGMFVEFIAPIFAVIMFFAIYLVHFSKGFNNMAGGYEFQLLLLLSCIGLSFVGSGCALVNRLTGKNKANCVCPIKK
jgi:putative oxidoreductase